MRIALIRLPDDVASSAFAVSNVDRLRNQPSYPRTSAFVEGSAALERNGEVEPVAMNMPVVEGDRLRTTSGRLQLAFPDGSAVDLDPNSDSRISSAPRRVRVFAGTIENRPAMAVRVSVRDLTCRRTACRTLPISIRTARGSTTPRTGTSGIRRSPQDWRPYYYGYWSSVPSYGWTWIGYNRWAWPTHHYGRWGYAQQPVVLDSRSHVLRTPGCRGERHRDT